MNLCEPSRGPLANSRKAPSERRAERREHGGTGDRSTDVAGPGEAAAALVLDRVRSGDDSGTRQHLVQEAARKRRIGGWTRKAASKHQFDVAYGFTPRRSRLPRSRLSSL